MKAKVHFLSTTSKPWISALSQYPHPRHNSWTWWLWFLALDCVSKSSLLGTNPFSLCTLLRFVHCQSQDINASNSVGELEDQDLLFDGNRGRGKRFQALKWRWIDQAWPTDGRQGIADQEEKDRSCCIDNGHDLFWFFTTWWSGRYLGGRTVLGPLEFGGG
jgi:hypothetical protein